jgi:hypothetical protein
MMAAALNGRFTILCFSPENYFIETKKARFKYDTDFVLSLDEFLKGLTLPASGCRPLYNYCR